MKLPRPFIQLPLLFDAGVLAAEIDALGEGVWRDHPQKFPGNSMLPLLAVGGDPANESFAGAMAPTPELLRCPYLVQVMASFGATLGRTRLMRLAGQAEVTPHVDQGYYWAERVRVHVPIVTQPTVRFECGAAVINMAAGECWIFDTWRNHNVINDASQSRIHLVADTVGGEAFWNLVAAGRGHEADRTGWQPARIAPSAAPVELVLEHYNIPQAMSPWEANYHMRRLLDDADPHDPALPAAHAQVERFFQAWRGLWARYADSGEGQAEYWAALERFVQQVPEPVAMIRLANGTRWIDGVLARVAKMAIRRS